MNPAALTYRLATCADFEALTLLVIGSKASNGYSAAFMQAFQPELVINRESLETGEIWVAECDGALTGMMHLVVDHDMAEVEAMFVHPDCKRGGVGRQLWLLLEARSRALGATSVELDADPFAVGFYEAMGCSVIGESPSGSIPGRMLPRMRKTLR